MIFINGIPVKIPTNTLVSISEIKAWIFNLITRTKSRAIAARVIKNSSVVVIY
jgi:hypothetical protein